MSTSNVAAPSSLVRAIERIMTKHRTLDEELARRARAIEEEAPSRRRTWRETKSEILGHPG